MSQTLTIPDDLYACLEDTARRRGVSIEDILWQAGNAGAEARRRHMAVTRIEATRAALAARYGAMPDSVDLIREDRAR